MSLTVVGREGGVAAERAAPGEHQPTDRQPLEPAQRARGAAEPGLQPAPAGARAGQGTSAAGTQSRWLGTQV